MLIIPTEIELAAYRFQITIEGVIYIFQFRWNTIHEYWTFDILNYESVPLISGVKVVINYPLLNRYASSLLPPGEIIALDTSGKLERVGRNDLGDSVKLIYVTAAEYDALI